MVKKLLIKLKKVNINLKIKLFISLSFSIINISMLLLLNGPATNVSAAGQSGSVDPFFKTGAGPNGHVQSITVQNDGKILIGGNFTTYNNFGRRGIARLNPDSTIDGSFNIGIGLSMSNIAQPAVNKIVVQNDGKILIGGVFNSYNGVGRNYLARLNADGTLDESFVVGWGITPYDYATNISTIGIQKDGKIIIGGRFTGYGGLPSSGLARVNPDGSPDKSFKGGDKFYYNVRTLAIQSDDKIVLGGIRLNADGSPDTSFMAGINTGSSTNNRINTVAIQPDGKILIGGTYSSDSGSVLKNIARLNPDGSLDTSFDTSKTILYGNEFGDGVRSIVVQNDGKIILGGKSFGGYKDSSLVANNLIRLNSDGSLDASFDVGTDRASMGSTSNEGVISLALHGTGKVLVGGLFPDYLGGGPSRVYFARLNDNGSLDASFLPLIGPNSTVTRIQVQNDGKIIIYGKFTIYNSTPSPGVARLNSDATLDTSFASCIDINSSDYKGYLQTDGKYIIYGNAKYKAPYNSLARLNADCSLDTSFTPALGAEDTVEGITKLEDGRYMLNGLFNTVKGFKLLNSDGSRDTSFKSTNAVGYTPEYTYVLLTQRDGKTIVVDMYTCYNENTCSTMKRLNTDGSLDSSFTQHTFGSWFGGPFFGLMELSNSQFIFTFSGRGNDATPVILLERWNNDGNKDTTFNPGGAGPNGYVFTVLEQTDGKLLLGGEFTSYNSTLRYKLARINFDGSLDTSFNTNIDPIDAGTPSNIGSIVIQKDGRILIGGMFTAVDNRTRSYLARLEANNTAPSSVAIAASPNPATVGSSVTLTATVSPVTAKGVVQFNFGSNITVLKPLVNGIATYITNTLPAGTSHVQAIYGGDDLLAASGSLLFDLAITQSCSGGANPLIVTKPSDDGHATICGTFSYALLNATSGATITFALPSGGNTISFSDPLVMPVKAGVNIDGGAGAGIVLEGNWVRSDGLQLVGGNHVLTNLTLRRFGGREILSSAGIAGNRFYHVLISS